MLLSRCCDAPVDKSWNLLMTKEHHECTKCGRELGYNDMVWVKTK